MTNVYQQEPVSDATQELIRRSEEDLRTAHEEFPAGPMSVDNVLQDLGECIRALASPPPAQADDEFTSDDDALEFLKTYGHDETGNGIIQGDWRSFDAKCRRAVQYLCDEWDFVFEDTAQADDGKDAEIERLETELNHFYDLCVDDPGKNPPLFWKYVASEQKAIIRELVAALEHVRGLREQNRQNPEPLVEAALAKAKAAGYSNEGKDNG